MSNKPGGGITISKIRVAGIVLLWLASLHVVHNGGNRLQSSAFLNNLSTPISRMTVADNNSTVAITSPCRSSSISTSLAFEQSFGFFDDIPDDEWKLRQQRARQHRHYNGHPRNLWNKDKPASNIFFYSYEPLFSCPLLYRVGGTGDGPKWTCDPQRIKKKKKKKMESNMIAKQISNTTTYGNITEESACLVYSIGSAGKYMWEDGLINMLGPNVCEFHIFDPGHYDRPNHLNTQRNIHYHMWGIQSSYHSVSYSRAVDRRGVPILDRTDFKTFPETLRLLGHEHRTIDLLKADCEYCEWFCYRDWITYGDVRQLLIETHHAPLPETVDGYWPWPGTNMTPFEFFDDLERANYIMFNKEPNIHPKNKVRERQCQSYCK